MMARVVVENTGNRLLIGPLAQDLQNGYTIAVDTVIGDNTVTLVDSTGFVANSLIKIEEEVLGVPTTFYGQVLTNVANVLTLDRPIDRAFTASALVNRENFLLDVNGSVTPVVFSYKNSFSKPVNVTRLLFNMVTTNPATFNGFGDIAAPGLSNGIELRKKNADGTFTNYFNAKTNNRLQLLMFDVVFFDGGNPQAVNGLSGRLTFERLSSPVILRQGEELQLVVQDDLTSLISFEMVAEGNREG
jgi:hypothetical protein